MEREWGGESREHVPRGGGEYTTPGQESMRQTASSECDEAGKGSCTARSAYLGEATCRVHQHPFPHREKAGEAAAHRSPQEELGVRCGRLELKVLADKRKGEECDRVLVGDGDGQLTVCAACLKLVRVQPVYAVEGRLACVGDGEGTTAGHGVEGSAKGRPGFAPELAGIALSRISKVGSSAVADLWCMDSTLCSCPTHCSSTIYGER